MSPNTDIQALAESSLNEEFASFKRSVLGHALFLKPLPGTSEKLWKLKRLLARNYPTNENLDKFAEITDGHLYCCAVRVYKTLMSSEAA